MKKITFPFLVLLQASFGFSQDAEIELAKVETAKTFRVGGVTQSLSNFEQNITVAFKTGNAAKIAEYFAGNIDLSINEKSSLYSKSQAHQILKNFFIADAPVSFTVMHQGNIDKNSFYLIGELKTAQKKTYRVTINSRQLKGLKLITSLAIEKASYLPQ